MSYMERAIMFVALFFVGGIFGWLFLPEFVGRFFITGLIFATLGTAASVNLNLGRR